MDAWEELKKACSNCRNCGLAEGRTKLVFGVGNENADLMFIGEGPGEQEDLRGEPFVGPAGKLLDTMLEIIHLRRDEVYIANIIKCRPPRNRDPLPDEQHTCAPWLDRQISLIQPKIIVFLGRISASYYLGDDFRITRDHGKWYDWRGIRSTALYHPSALLRDPSRRPETFVDLKSIERELNLIRGSI